MFFKRNSPDTSTPSVRDRLNALSETLRKMRPVYEDALERARDRGGLDDEIQRFQTCQDRADGLIERAWVMSDPLVASTAEDAVMECQDALDALLGALDAR